MTLESALRRHVERLAEPRCPRMQPHAHTRAREYVARELGRLGKVELISRSLAGEEIRNLRLRLGPPDGQPIIVGAHYDSVPNSPGADDNASGVAVLMEAAQACRAKSAVWFYAFDAEEWGMPGSELEARELKRAKQPIRMMLSLEMMGYRRDEPGTQRYPPFLKFFYPNRGDFIGVIGNGAARREARRLASCLRGAGVKTRSLIAPLRGRLISAVRLSDHAPFWDRGYPAALVTDTAFMRNPNYHQPSDTPETLDYAFMAGITRALIRYLSS